MSAAVTDAAEIVRPAPEDPLNIADRIRTQAGLRPHARAVVVPHGHVGGRRTYAHWTFRQLNDAIDRYARGLHAFGVKKGMRTLLMVTPSLEFFGLTFALQRLGAVPVMIDPAMGKANVLGAISEVEPEAFVAIPKGHVVRVLFGKAFSSVKISVTVGKKLLWGGHTLEDVEARGASGAPYPSDTLAKDLAAILFTSGSTGAPKGVLYTHAIFHEQIRIFEEDFGIEPGEVDLSAFPLFSLFSAALGVTVLVPDMDATKPAFVDPEVMVEHFADQGVTYAFGSPAFWKRVADHALEKGVVFDSMRRVLMAGAPAPVDLLEKLVKIVPESADVFTPYGATECLPISLPSARRLLEDKARRTGEGKGTCVGRPMRDTEIRIIEIQDDPIERAEDAKDVPRGQIGEICVKSPVTTQGYFRRPADDAKSKMADADRKWHRMGDVGWMDEDGDLWFCGRKSHRVKTSDGPMFTVCCEAIFNAHPRVYRSALVGVGPEGAQTPVMIVECHAGQGPKGAAEEAKLRDELLALGAKSELTSRIRAVLFHESFPVDARHNAKIRREDLTVWAEKQGGAR